MGFVKPETVRIDLTHGEWIDIKRDLSKTEKIRFEFAGLGDRTNTGVKVDWVAMACGRISAYVVDWSLKGSSGKDVPVSKSAIDDLDEETFDEIDNAIKAHIEAREAEKKAQRTSQTSTPLSA